MQTVQIDGIISTIPSNQTASMTHKDPIARRERLVLTAARLIIEHGAGALTLDAVAAAAGVSKGGLLHHFPNKEALINGMLTHLIDVFVRRQDALLAREALGTPGRWLRAYIDISFADPVETDVLEQAMMHLVVINPALRKHLADKLTYLTQCATDDGLPPALAQMIRLACDGFWLGCIFGMPVPDADACAALHNQLLEMTRVSSPTHTPVLQSS
jgi:AcrR family transcriptional regulator